MTDTDHIADQLCRILTGDEALVDAVHNVAAEGHELNLLPEQVRTLSKLLKAGTLLGHTCQAILAKGPHPWSASKN